MIKGYKASYDGRCLFNSYEVGNTYSFKGRVIPCSQGFHFCEKLKDVFAYYQNRKDKNLVIFQIEAVGKIAREEDKLVTDKIKIIRILEEKEYEEFIDIYRYNSNKNLVYKRETLFENQKEWWFEYDKNNNLISSKNNKGFKETRTYNDDGLIIQGECVFENQKSIKFSYTYEGDDTVIFNHSCGITFVKKYDKNKNLIYFKNSRGIEEITKYDEKNNKVSVEGSNGYREEYRYDSDNRLVYFMTSYGRGFENEYEGKTKTSRIINRNGEVICKKYDEFGNLIYDKYSDRDANIYEYDKNNNLIHIKKSDGYEEWKEFDDKNNLVSYRNTLGNSYSISSEKTLK